MTKEELDRCLEENRRRSEAMASTPRTYGAQGTMSGMQPIWWSVGLDAAGEEVYELERLEDFAEAMHAHSGCVTGSPEQPEDGLQRYGAQFSLQALSVDEAVASAVRIFAAAVATAGLPLWPIVKAEAMTEHELDLELARPPV